MKSLIIGAIYLGGISLVTSVLFRLIGKGAPLPFFSVSPDAVLRLANSAFLAAISIGVYLLVAKKY